MLNNEVFTTEEAAAYLKINPQVLQRYLRAGDIPARKMGRQWRISKIALELWLVPPLATILLRMTIWRKAFELGNQLGKKLDLTDVEILAKIKNLRKERGISVKSSS